jgi:hypothetical protein
MDRPEPRVASAVRLWREPLRCASAGQCALGILKMFPVADAQLVYVSFGVRVEDSAVGGALAAGAKIAHGPVAVWPFRDLKYCLRRSICWRGSTPRASISAIIRSGFAVARQTLNVRVHVSLLRAPCRCCGVVRVKQVGGRFRAGHSSARVGQRDPILQPQPLARQSHAVLCSVWLACCFGAYAPPASAGAKCRMGCCCGVSGYPDTQKPGLSLFHMF